MAKAPSQPEPIVLTTNCIVDGVFIPAGDPVPYTSEKDLPETLRPLVALGDEEPPYHPAERNIYFGSPAGRGQARRILGNVLLQDNVETAELAAQALPAETEEALQAAHDKASALAKAQLAGRAEQTDGIYEAAAQQAAATETQFYVRRGGEWGKVQNAKLRPGETCFVKRPNGEYEASGYVNAEGEPPDPEIYL